jgi:hypothetical protein
LSDKDHVPFLFPRFECLAQAFQNARIIVNKKDSSSHALNLPLGLELTR